MKTAVVIPAYNADRFLSQTVASVLAQTVDDWELIIVDDGSVDHTAAVARQFCARDPRIRVIQQPNVGLSCARNRGLAEASPASGQFIFLDADDVWECDALAVLRAALCSDSGSVAVSGLSRYIDERGLPFQPGELEVWGRRRSGVVGQRLISWPTGQPTTLGVLAYRNCIGTPGQVLVRRTALEEAGSFDPATSPCEDWDMWLRLCRLGHIGYVDEVLLNKRKHGDNLSSQSELMYRQQVAVRRKLVGSPLTREQRRLVRAANWHWTGYVCTVKLRLARYSLSQRQPIPAALLLCEAAAGCIQRVRGLLGS
jgi:glycosyltransferase involved in cell wall biosynthesis